MIQEFVPKAVETEFAVRNAFERKPFLTEIKPSEPHSGISRIESKRKFARKAVQTEFPVLQDVEREVTF